MGKSKGKKKDLSPKKQVNPTNAKQCKKQPSPPQQQQQSQQQRPSNKSPPSLKDNAPASETRQFPSKDYCFGWLTNRYFFKFFHRLPYFLVFVFYTVVPKSLRPSPLEIRHRL
jgi:hypothetical protein